MDKSSVSKNKNIHSGHRKRLKKNVGKNGFSYLEDHQLLELLLFYSIPQADTNVIAHNLLEEFGSLKEVFEQNPITLKHVKGVGENTACMLCAMKEAYNRINTLKTVKKRVYKTTEDFVELAASNLADSENEKCLLFCFDSSKRLKKTVILSEGDRYSTTFDVRVILQTAMDCKAEFVVLAHNHPTGEVSPSASDMDTTRSLCVTLRKIGVYMADHIIIGLDGEFFSMYSDPRIKGLFY